MLPLIISCTRSWNFSWHFFGRSTTESKNIVKLLAISQTIHTVCCEGDYFPKAKFKLFNSLLHSVYLVFQKVCFLLPLCLPYVVCGSYVTKINAVLWHSAPQTFPSLGLFTSLVYVCTYCLPMLLWIKTSELDYSIWVTPPPKKIYARVLHRRPNIRSHSVLLWKYYISLGEYRNKLR